MEKIIEKLKEVKDKKDWDHWEAEEKKQLLDIYWILCKKESYIFKLIWSYHGCDTWEDIFRDYDNIYLKDKAVGVKIAIEEIEEEISREKEKEKEKERLDSTLEKS